MAQIEHLPASSSVDEINAVLERDGAVIVDDVLAEKRDQIANELAPFLDNKVYGRDEFTGFSTQRIGALVARSETCGELALHPQMLAAGRSVWPICDDIQLHFTSAVCIGPGESEQILHRDRGIWGGICQGRWSHYSALSGRLPHSLERTERLKWFPVRTAGTNTGRPNPTR